MVEGALKQEFAKLGVSLIPLEAGGQCLVDELREGAEFHLATTVREVDRDLLLPTLAIQAYLSHSVGGSQPVEERDIGPGEEHRHQCVCLQIGQSRQNVPGV
jgi:hypothetical protein